MLIHNLTNHITNIGGCYHANHFGGWCGRNLRIWRCDCMCGNNHIDYAILNQTTKEIGQTPFSFWLREIYKPYNERTDSLIG